MLTTSKQQIETGNAAGGELLGISFCFDVENHGNQQYSVTAITNSSAGVVERYAYQAYGEPTILDASASVLSSSSISNRYTYTGREWDGTIGLYHFRARWMSGLTGRFLTRDPIGFDGGMNLFAYLDGRVLRFTDPSGLKNDDDGSSAVDRFLALIPVIPCGSVTLTVNATAIGPVVDDSWLATDAMILVIANKEIAKAGLPWTRSASTPCPGGRCCPLSSITYNDTFIKRGKYTANVPRFGVVKMSFNIDIRMTTVYAIGVCIKNNCPCPLPNAPIVVNRKFDHSKYILDLTDLENRWHQLLRQF
jgi:RHS repeat-associated protein